MANVKGINQHTGGRPPDVIKKVYSSDIWGKIAKIDDSLSKLNFIVSKIYPDWQSADESLITMKKIFEDELERLLKEKNG